MDLNTYIKVLMLLKILVTKTNTFNNENSDPCSFQENGWIVPFESVCRNISEVGAYCEHMCEGDASCWEHGQFCYDAGNSATAYICEQTSVSVYHSANVVERITTLEYVLSMSLGIGRGFVLMLSIVIICLCARKRRQIKLKESLYMSEWGISTKDECNTITMLPKPDLPKPGEINVPLYSTIDTTAQPYDLVFYNCSGNRAMESPTYVQLSSATQSTSMFMLPTPDLPKPDYSIRRPHISAHPNDVYIGSHTEVSNYFGGDTPHRMTDMKTTL